MKAIIKSLKRTHWFKALMALFVCLSFLILPSCQKVEIDQDPMLDIDVMSSSALAKKGRPTVGKIRDVDGNWYKTVKIGTQWWMAENLKTTRYYDGSGISYPGDDMTAWINNTTGAYAWYNNEEATYKNPYGALYNWYAVNTDKLCPRGWRVPTEADFAILITYCGGQFKAGTKLKATGTIEEEDGLWYLWVDQAYVAATNESGFSALPGGFHYVTLNGSYGYGGIGFWGQWWTASEYYDNVNNYEAGVYLILSYGAEDANLQGYLKPNGYSVRCLKDQCAP